MTDGRAVLVTGATGSGKTVWTRQQVKACRRLLVWDALGEWSRLGLVLPVDGLGLLRGIIHQQLDGKRAPARVGYTGPGSVKHFEAFCRLAWVWLRIAPGALVVEELADVTTPGRAPAAWGEIVRKGRHYQAQVYAITQRPAESDKTILSNAAAVHCGMMAYPRDRAYMAEVLDVPQREVAALGPLQWIERDMRTRELRRGKVRP